MSHYISALGLTLTVIISLLGLATLPSNKILAAFRRPYPRATPTPTRRPTPTPTARPTPTPTPITTPVPSNLKFGVVVEDYTNGTGQLSSLQTTLHNHINTVSVFKQFGNPNNATFDPTEFTYIKSNGMKVQLAWEPWNPDQGMNQQIDILKQIPNGSYDTYIHTFAQSLKNYGGPVVLSCHYSLYR